MKRCSLCGIRKPFDDFSKESRSKDGYQSRCKSCRRADYQANKEKVLRQSSEYYEANKERKAEISREWRRVNRDREKETRKAWYEANKNHKLAKNREWRQANRDRMTELKSEWRQANPERGKQLSRLHGQARRARKADNGIFLVTDKDLTRIYDSPCVSCGSTEDMTADHIIPISRGGQHSIGNLQSLCYSCNSSKHDRLMIEWRAKKAREARQDEAA